MTTHDEVRAAIKAWWDAHPNFREKYKPLAPFDVMCRSVVHWHHNVELSLQHDRKSLDGDRFFLRQYAHDATRAWLLEAQANLERFPPDHAHWRGYGHIDQECLIRNLQIALDAFDANKAEQP